MAVIAGNLELAEMIQNYKPEDIGKLNELNLDSVSSSCSALHPTKMASPSPLYFKCFTATFIPSFEHLNTH